MADMILYTEQENGTLKPVAELEGFESADMAVDALLDENPRLKTTEFVVVTGALEDGVIERVTVESDEPVQPRRRIRRSRGQEEPAKRTTRKAPSKPQSTRKPAAAKPKQQTTRKPATAKPATKKPAAKPAAKKPAAPTRKPAAPKQTTKKPAAKKSGGSPFKRNAKSDE